MASEAANIGANFSQYTGDPSLGGGTLGAVRIDTRPMEDLARYTLLYNKSLFDQRQKDADEKIAQFAKLATIHVNDLRGKDRDEIIAELNDVITYAQDYARKSPKNPKEKIEQSLEWQKKTLNLYNNFDSGKARSVKYTAELDKIENDKTISDATKAEKRKELEQLFGGTKISEQFGGVPDYTLSSISIPSPATLKANIIQEGANANLDEALTIFNYKVAGQRSFNMLNGLNALYLDEKTLQGQTPQARQQRTVESESKLWRETGDVMNSIIKEYQTVVDGKVVFDAKRFEDENAGNKKIMEPYNALKNMDADARAKFSQAQQGRLSDRGFGFKLPPNFTADDFREGFVDFTKPIPAEKILTAGQFSKFLGDTVEKTIQQTDNAIQWANYGLSRDRLNKADKEDLLGANSVINEISDVINSGKPQVVQNYLRSGKEKEILEISDPNLLKEFATIDKDNKTTKTPDVIQFDKEKNQLNLVYFDSKLSKSGKRLINESISLSPTQWIGQIVKRKFPNKDIGGINNIVDEVYNANGRNLFKLSQKIAGKVGTQNSTPEGTMDEWLATPGWTKERISEYEKKGLIKVKQ